ncbi:MAG: hypothetical protein GY754_44655 [bacterium]|nr:hypothetical protein [bacterium]
MRFGLSAVLLVPVLLFSVGCLWADESRRLFKDIPRDGKTVHYLGDEYSRKDYKKLKKKELAEFKEDLKDQYGLTFKTRNTKYFNIAYRCSNQGMNHRQNYLTRFFEQVYPRYFRYEPKHPFRVVYFKSKITFRQHTGSPAYGYFNSGSHTLTTYYTYSGHGTLWHEMIHAFVDENIDGNTQQWFSEGFASFYEMAFLYKNKVVEGYTNWRMPILQRAIREGRFVPLKEFMLPQFMSIDFGYAEGRFLFCYLWVHGKMKPFVNSYLYELCPKYSGVKLGRKSIEKIEELMGKNIDQINKEVLAMAKRVGKNQKLVRRRVRRRR